MPSAITSRAEHGLEGRIHLALKDDIGLASHVRRRMQVDDEQESNAHVEPLSELFNKLPNKSKTAVKPLLMVGSVRHSD